MMYFSAAVSSPASFGSIVTRSSICVKELTSTSSCEQAPSVEEEAQHEVVGSLSCTSSFTDTCTWSSAISTILRSGSDLIITGGSNLGVVMARETVGEEGEDEDEEEEKGEVEENATEEEVEGKEKTVVGKPGWPRGVRMIVFVPENGGRV